MNYSQKYFDEIFESMLDDSLEKGLISHAEEFKDYIANQQDISNYYVLDKSVIAEMFAKFYESLTSVYDSNNIEIATGEDLDNIGNIVGVIRPPATNAMVNLTFTAPAPVSSTPVSIAENVIVRTENNIQYRTIEEINIPVGESECTVQAIAVNPGVSSKVGANTLTIVVSDLDTNLSVNNPLASSGGKDEYTDDEYRELLLVWPLIHLKGSEEAYMNYFANFDGIDGYKLVPNWDGSGTMKIILDPGTTYQLNLAYNELQESITQATEDIVMFSPTEKPIDIYAVCNVDIDRINPYSETEKEIIASKIKESIRIFVDGGYRNDGVWYPGLMIGEDFIPHKLAVFLDNEISELKDINFTHPTDYVSISDEEICVSNDIVIEMI